MSTFPSGSAPVQDLTLTYSISNTSSASATLDFTALPGTVVIPAGSTVASISVTALDDNVLESTETVQITLIGSSSPSHTIVYRLLPKSFCLTPTPQLFELQSEMGV